MKPARLFAAHMPTFANRLAQWRRPRPPTSSPLGKQAEHVWALAQAKSYPPCSSGGLAYSMAESAIAHRVELSCIEPLNLVERYQLLSPQLSQDHADFGADHVDNIFFGMHFKILWKYPLAPPNILCE